MGTYLVVQWLRLYTSDAGHVGSIPVWGTKILQAKGDSAYTLQGRLCTAKKKGDMV